MFKTGDIVKEKNNDVLYRVTEANNFFVLAVSTVNTLNWIKVYPAGLYTLILISHKQNHHPLTSIFK